MRQEILSLSQKLLTSSNVQNVYDTPFEGNDHLEIEDADRKPSPKAYTSGDILTELGLDPNDDPYESPVWSDSDVQSWGDGQNIPTENEPIKATSKIELCTTESESDIRPGNAAHKRTESQTSPAKHATDKQEGGADDKVLPGGYSYSLISL